MTGSPDKKGTVQQRIIPMRVVQQRNPESNEAKQDHWEKHSDTRKIHDEGTDTDELMT